MKVLTVVGARPQFVKAFPVSRALAADHEEYFLHTGQHYDEALSGVFFEELGLPEPDENLGVGSGPHGAQTAAMLEGIEAVVRRESPDVVLTYGDTNSTLASAVAGAKAEPTVAHVEAGLRSDERDMPEEINRVITDHAADLLLAPTDRAAERLAAEGLGKRTYVTGDVMYDSLQWARDHAAAAVDPRADYGLDPRGFVLATVHRPRNADNPERLRTILEALAATPEPVVMPLHPRTAERIEAFDLGDLANDAATLVDPLGYLEFLGLLDAADRAVTDSGGVQKEAFLLETPCVTLREETEWVETVEAGGNVLVGADRAAIIDGLEREFTPDPDAEPFGDGTAAETIVETLERER